jgi:hypothetical protein
VGFKKRKRLRRYDITASSGRNKRKPPGENKSKGRVKKKKKDQTGRDKEMRHSKAMAYYIISTSILILLKFLNNKIKYLRLCDI